jgi:hypothetical protein
MPCLHVDETGSNVFDAAGIVCLVFVGEGSDRQK